MDNNEDDNFFEDIFFDEIIRTRAIAHRTNWRCRFIALNQNEVAEVAIDEISGKDAHRLT